MTAPSPYPYPAADPREPGPKPISKTLGILALVFGIIALAMSPVPIINNIGIILGFAALILGVIGIWKSTRGISIAGGLCGLAGIVIGLVLQAQWSSELDQIGKNIGAADPAPNTAVQQPAADDSHSGTYKWGQTDTKDPIQTTVSTPKIITSSQWASPSSAKAWAVEITLHNTTGQAFPVAMLSINGKNGTHPAQQVMDSDKGYDGGMSAGSLPPGQTLTIKEAFTTDGGPHSIVISSMDGMTTATWTS